MSSSWQDFVNSWWKTSLPPFDTNLASPYDQSTYVGRALHFYRILDPRTLLVTDLQLQECQKKLSHFKTRGGKNAGNKDSNNDLWESKRIVDSMVHPDTKEKIPLLFRFSAFAIVNIPICVLLLYPGSSNLQVFAQFVNQSYNVAVNYCNRNASGDLKTQSDMNKKLVTSYAGALTASCGIAWSLRKVVSALPKESILVRGFIPYVALTVVSCLNLCIVRANELQEGISVRVALPSTNAGDSQSAETREIDIGNSKVAGQEALMKCCVARIVWSVPPMFFPPFAMKHLFMKRKWFMRMGFWGKLSVEAALIGLTVMTFIPPSMALFPQKDSIPGHRMEKHLLSKVQQMTQLDESVIKEMKFFYNKGL